MHLLCSVNPLKYFNIGMLLLMHSYKQHVMLQLVTFEEIRTNLTAAGSLIQ